MGPPEELERDGEVKVRRLRQSHSYGFVLVLLVAAVVTGLIMPDTNRREDRRRRAPGGSAPDRPLDLADSAAPDDRSRRSS